MPRRLLLALILLVAAPLVSLAWISATAAKAQEVQARERLAETLSRQLATAREPINELFADYQGQLDREITDPDLTAESLKRMRRTLPLVRQCIFINSSGQLIYPGAADLVDDEALQLLTGLVGLVDSRPATIRNRQIRREAANFLGSNSAPQQSYLPINDLQQQAAEQQLPNQLQILPPVQQAPIQQTPLQQAPIQSAPNQQAPSRQSRLPQVPTQQAEALPQRAGRQIRQVTSTPPLQNADVQVLASEQSFEPANGFDNTLGQQTAAQPATSAWQQWFMAGGVQLVYWRALPDGRAVGVLLQRGRWMSDLLAALPDSSGTISLKKNATAGQPLKTAAIGGIALVDESDHLVYQWGEVSRIDLEQNALSQRNLPMPLASWQLKLYVDPALIPKADPSSIYFAIAALAVILGSIGVYVLTAVQRQINAARQRVSFAGQVSHELRTPLTNIRLYTELAESDLDQPPSDQLVASLQKRLGVIDHECKRLQRLVDGVLEMIRPQGKSNRLRLQQTDIPSLIQRLEEQFQPGFRSAGLTLNVECDVQQSAMLDTDIIEIVLVNLLGNVEKYVPSGGTCAMTCVTQTDSQGTQQLQIIVNDDGPGIPNKHRQRIFRAFQRLDDSINAPSGTGLGLTIARRAAERHHGQLELLTESPLGGAAFRFTVPLDLTTP